MIMNAKKLSSVFVLLSTLGLATLHILLEVQTRYHQPFMVFFFLLIPLLFEHTRMSYLQKR